MDTMVARTSRRTARLLAAVCLLGSLVAGVSAPVAASGPNIVAQWNKIAEDTVVGSGAQQIEGMIYMSYTQTAVYDALVAIYGTYEPYGPALTAPVGASADAAVVEAAYTTLANYFPGNATVLRPRGPPRCSGSVTGRPRPTASRSAIRQPWTSSRSGTATGV